MNQLDFTAKNTWRDNIIQLLNAMRDEVQDRYGNTIYLTDERWEHILEDHPELDGHRAEVISSVRSGKRRQDPMIPNKCHYNKKFPDLSEEFDEIEVVVLFKWQNDRPNNFIITAYPAYIIGE